MSDIKTIPISNSPWNESKKPPYQIDQQVKFLHLAAEVESLWQQLQSIVEERLATADNKQNSPQIDYSD